MINKIRKDHLLHFIAGSYIVLVTMMFTKINWQIILILVLIAAATELVYDKWLGKGTPEVSDAFATVLGGLATLFLTQIILG